MFADQLQTGEREPGGPGFQLSVGLVIVIMEKSPRKAESLFVKAKSGRDVFYV